MAVLQDKFILRKMFRCDNSIMSKLKSCWDHIKKIIIYLNNINRLVLLMMTQSFLCEMTEFLCITQAEFKPQRTGRGSGFFATKSPIYLPS
jgi:hypothetical protein